jgi:hypothetical protein
VTAVGGAEAGGVTVSTGLTGRESTMFAGAVDELTASGVVWFFTSSTAIVTL